MKQWITAMAWLIMVATVPPAGASGVRYNYLIRLNKDTGGLDIAVQSYAGPAVVISLHNRSNKAASCAAVFQYFPHAASADEIRSTKIAPGQRRALTYPVRSFGDFSTAYVTLRCVPKTTEADPRNLLLQPPAGAAKK